MSPYRQELLAPGKCLPAEAPNMPGLLVAGSLQGPERKTAQSCFRGETRENFRAGRGEAAPGETIWNLPGLTELLLKRIQKPTKLFLQAWEALWGSEECAAQSWMEDRRWCSRPEQGRQPLAASPAAHTSQSSLAGQGKAADSLQGWDGAGDAPWIAGGSSCWD